MKRNNPTHVITHHANGTLRDRLTSSKHQDVYIIDDWHATRWPGFTSKSMRRADNNKLFHCGYHLVTDLNAKKTTKTRQYTEEGAHCIGKNTSSIGWLIIGNYTKDSDDELTDEDIKFLRHELRHVIVPAMKNFNIPISNIRPHRNWAPKDCHGSQLSDTFFSDLLVDTDQDKVEELREKVALITALVQQLQRLVIQLMNRLTRKRLAFREKNINKV